MATLSHAHIKTLESDAETAASGAASEYGRTARKLVLLVALGVLAWTIALAPFFLSV